LQQFFKRKAPSTTLPIIGKFSQISLWGVTSTLSIALLQSRASLSYCKKPERRQYYCKANAVFFFST